jgi:cell division septation protein DedD
MESGLKQRLVGAAVLVALAVIFLPMLVQGPAPDSGVSNVPLTMPPAPRGEMETRDLPLVTPGDAPTGGAVGLAPAVPADTAAPTSTVGTTAAPATVPASTTTTAAAATTAPADIAPSAPLPAATAGGDYAVTFGAYATPAAADTVIASLRTTPLPAYREPTTSGGKPAWRVRIGPFATRAEAESARLRAAHVRDDVKAQVVELDAPPAATTPAAAAQTAPATVATTKPVSATTTKPAPNPTSQSSTGTTTKPAAPATAPVVASAATAAAKPTTTPSTTTPKPPAASATGFAVQLAAYGKASDATALRDRLRAAGFSAFTEAVTTDKGTLTRVRVGPVATRGDAQQLQAQVKAKVGLDGIVRPHP